MAMKTVRSRRALARLLAENAGRIVPREEIARHIWGAAPPATWPTVLRVQVHCLREELGHLSIRTRFGVGWVMTQEAAARWLAAQAEAPRA